MKSVTGFLGVFVSLGMASAALAQPGVVVTDDAGQRQAVVAYADLDLASKAGAAMLARRLEMAAKAVCGPPPSTLLDLGGQARFNRCTDQAAATALAGLHRPQVAAAYASR